MGRFAGFANDLELVPQRFSDFSLTEPAPNSDNFQELLGMQYSSGAGRTPATTLELSGSQMRRQRAAKRENRRLYSEFAEVGREEEFETYLKQEGKTGLFGTIDYELKDVLTPTFDLLSIGNYTMAGMVQEIVRTGSAWEGFKQASIEFANALPFVELEEARRPSFIDVFDEMDMDNALGWTLGLMMDIVLDPINFVPGGRIAKALLKQGSKAVKKSGAVGRVGRMLFSKDRELDAVGHLKDIVLERLGSQQSLAKHSTARLTDDVRHLYANLNETQRRMVGGLMAKPKLLKDQLEHLKNINILDQSQIDQAMEAVDTLTKFNYEEIAVPEVAYGLLDARVIDDFYMYGVEAQTSVGRKAITQAVEDTAGRVNTGIGASGLPYADTSAGFAQSKKFPTVGDRLIGSLSGTNRNRAGDIITTEVSVANILPARIAQSQRWIHSKAFINDIVNDNRIAAKLSNYSAETLKDPEKWKVYKENVVKYFEGYDVFETTRKKLIRGEHVDVVTGAFLMPVPIVDFIKKTEALLENTDDLGTMMTGIDKVTSIWRGWATVGTGYLARNHTTGMIINWLQEVGSASHGGYVLKHLQALRVQSIMDGASKIPDRARRAADAATAGLAKKGMRVVPDPNVVIDGKRLSLEEIGWLAEKHDVTQTATRAWNSGEDALKGVWDEMEPSVSIESIMKADLDPRTKALLTYDAGVKAPVTETLNKALGTENMLVTGTRALSQISENNFRMALFIDRLEKGQSAVDAALATKINHFDYTKLTEIEKKVFRVVLPFYAWSRFAAPRMVMMTIENPGRMARIPKFRAAIENLSNDWEDLPTPDYYDEMAMLQIPFVRKDKPLFLQVDMPMLELNKANRQDVTASLHPFLKRIFETIPDTGYSLFLGAPEERFPGEASSVLPVSRGTENTMTTMFPPLGKFVTRPIKAWQRGEFPEQVISEMLGFRLRALDTERVLRGNVYEYNKRAREFKKRLQQEEVL